MRSRPILLVLNKHMTARQTEHIEDPPSPPSHPFIRFRNTMPLPRDKYWQGNRKKGDQVCFAAVGIGLNLKHVKPLPAAQRRKTKRAVLLFRILNVSIRIRIRGYVPLDYGSGSWPSFQWLSKYQQKLVVFQIFLLITLVVGIFTFYISLKR